MSPNALVIGGLLQSLSPKRVTPAGVPVVEGVIEHQSRQLESGLDRTVEVSVPFVALGDLAQAMTAATLGISLEATGFIAARSAKSGRLVLHVTEIRFVEGNQDGFQTQAS